MSKEDWYVIDNELEKKTLQLCNKLGKITCKENITNNDRFTMGRIINDITAMHREWAYNKAINDSKTNTKEKGCGKEFYMTEESLMPTICMGNWLCPDCNANMKQGGKKDVNKN